MSYSPSLSPPNPITWHLHLRLCDKQALCPWNHTDNSTLQSLSRVRLCDPMNRSMPGLPVHHHLQEFTQTHVHRVHDAIQPSHPQSSPSPPAPNTSQHQSFSNESTLCMRWPKYWSFSFSIIPSKEIPGLIFRMDWSDAYIYPLPLVIFFFFLLLFGLLQKSQSSKN